MSPSNTTFSVFSCIGFFLVCIPLPWHLKASNIGTCSYSIWTALSLLSYCINSIIWNNDATNRAPVFCDISARLMIASTVGLTAASLCINRQLYNTTTLQTVSWSTAQKRRALMIDLAIAVGVPALSMILQFAVWFHRFSIFQELGCYPALSSSPLTMVLVNGPPVVLSLVSASYAIRSVIARRRAEEELKKYLATTSGFNASLWYRLLALATVEVFIALPMCLLGIVQNITFDQAHRQVSWDDAHSRPDISLVVEYPSAVWKTSFQIIAFHELPRWTRTFWAFTFFALFGFAEEARRHYKMAWDFSLELIGRASNKNRTPSLRFNTSAERSSVRGSGIGRDLDISIPSRGVNHNNGTAPDSLPEDEIREEAISNPPVIAHACRSIVGAVAP